ncbi:MAG TPA: 6-carboxytetrahydropterin synthase [bacterium]|nr:6-carboxytetrahydropterin synthase [bacterium]
MMYRLGIRRSFVAQHYLIGGDFGDESQWHSHHYKVEVRLTGETLNEHGYLADITEIEQALDTLLSRYRDATLNELPEFQGLNPSIEHFARIFHDRFASAIPWDNSIKLTIRLWEDPDIWTEYTDHSG